MKKEKMSAIFTDLDGTLLTSNNTVSQKDLEILHQLGEKNILRVIATGRSVFSAHRVLDPAFPIDYLIFSTGAGIMRWADKKIIYERNLPQNHIHNNIEVFSKHAVDFMIQHAIPENHRFVFKRFQSHNPDFDRRCGMYKEYCYELNHANIPQKACQFIGILHHELHDYENLMHLFPGQKVIRSTSPLDQKTVWFEVFHQDVSKANAAQYLINNYNIDVADTTAVGNDFNDLDLLHWAKNSFVVENAPVSIRKSFPTVSSCNHSGFSEAVLHTVVM